MQQPKSITERFLSKFDIPDDPNACWEWKDCTKAWGYGYFSVFRTPLLKMRAHRFSYLFYVGGIPEGLLVCHSCDNRACVNPRHLWIGTHSQNSQDAHDKGRGTKLGGSKPGEKAGPSFLKEWQVLDIREMSKQGLTAREIEKFTGVTYGNVRCILERKSWTHI